MTAERRMPSLPPSDTHPEVERLILEGLRRMTPAQKMERVASLNRTLEILGAAALRQSHPGISEREIQLRLASRRLGRDLMVRAFGWDPAVQGW